MSDAAVYSIVTGMVTIMTMVVGFLTLWVKLKYGVVKAEEAASNASRVERKIDHNTVLTTEAKDAANKASEHAANCDGERSNLVKMVSDHDTRITALERGVVELQASVANMTKNVDSTRHELRGAMQGVVSKLDLISMNMARAKPEVKK